MSELSNLTIRNKAVAAYIHKHIDHSLWAEQILAVNVIETIKEIVLAARDFKTPNEMGELCTKLMNCYTPAIGNQITHCLQEAIGDDVLEDIMRHPEGPDIFLRILESLGPLSSKGLYDPTKIKIKVKAVLAEIDDEYDECE